MNLKLQDIDPEDIQDLLIKIEKSFDFQFENKDLKVVNTFGELCDIIESKIHFKHVEDCTNQQAYYLVQSSLKKIGLNCELSPRTDLKLIFPKQGRRDLISKLEEELKFKTEILMPNKLISLILVLVLLAGFILLLSNLIYGFLAIGTALLGFWVSEKTGTNLKVQSLGELSKKIAREHYILVRRNKFSVNKSEIRPKIVELFSEEFEMATELLRNESKLILE